MSDTNPGPSSSNGECTQYICGLYSNAVDARRARLMDTTEEGHDEPTFSDRINKVVQEPLTPLTKILLILALVLLLVSSVRLFKIFSSSEIDALQVFIGLFTGAQHKLGLVRDGNPGETVTQTFTTTEYHTLPYTYTETGTLTRTKTSTTTTTHVHSSTKVGRTTTFTTTEKVTKTMEPVPIPSPTGGPGKVRNILIRSFENLSHVLQYDRMYAWNHNVLYWLGRFFLLWTRLRIPARTFMSTSVSTGFPYWLTYLDCVDISD